MGAGRALTGNPLGFIEAQEVFLVYEVTFDEASGVAIVKVEVHTGNPYDPNSQAQLSVSGTAIVGEVITTPDGEEIQIESPCFALDYAACDAVQQLIAMDFINKIDLPNRQPSAPATSSPTPTPTPDPPSTG